MVFTRVCHSVHEGRGFAYGGGRFAYIVGVCLPRGLPTRGVCLPTGLPTRDSVY